MKRYATATALVLAASLLSGCTLPPAGVTDQASPSTETTERQPQPTAASAYGGGAPQLFETIGDYHRPVTTDSEEAQRYFNQGLIWVYGFNHDEAVRSFTRAAELDPRCAMAWWGVAYAQGPNYNASGMNPARASAAWKAILRAQYELDDETPAEQALIRATAKRYRDPGADTEGQDKVDYKAAFAQAMARAWAKHPEDPDIGVLYADALMVRFPWRLWKSDGTPARAETLTTVEVLEHVLAFDPYHPGANHLYIHAVEASTDKQRGIIAADRLSAFNTLSGHLNHMPSHIYVQVGMWDRAVEQNIMAQANDEAYLQRSPVQYRQHGYIAHNSHMLAFAAMMVGRERDAMDGARSVWDMPDGVFETMGRRYDRAMCAIFDVMKRFGRWDDILAEPQPPGVLRQTTAMWRACRAVAYAAKQDFDNARAEHAEFKKLLEARPKDKFLRLNDHFIAGEIALQQQQWDLAIEHLVQAVKIEDTLGYGEPPRWLQPVRHTLGAVYHRAGRYADAERVYREDLAKWPGNGWSLLGLTRALELQNKTDEAAEVREQFERAWANADNPIDTSCECLPGL
ncbi:MAG: tetratricopeptide repeat protein [Planctomycetota bacterium]